MVSERDPREALPVWLPLDECDRRFGPPSVLDAPVREQILAWIDRSEDVQAELESVFDVAFGGDDEDLELLDGIVDGMLEGEPPSEEQLASMAFDWGLWLGEWFRASVGGDWAAREASEHACIRFARAGRAFFPVHAILLRFASPRDVRLVTLVEGIIRELSDGV